MYAIHCARSGYLHDLSAKNATLVFMLSERDAKKFPTEDKARAFIKQNGHWFDSGENWPKVVKVETPY